MRVALFSYAWPSPEKSRLFNPGVETLAWNLAKALSETIEVVVFASNSANGTEEREQGRVHVVLTGHRFRSGAFQLNQLDFARMVARNHRDEIRSCDILHDIGSLVPLLCKEFSHRGIATFHHYENPQTLRDLLQNFPIPLLLKRERSVRVIVAVSEFAKNQFVSQLGIRHRSIYVVPNGVDHTVFRRRTGPPKNGDVFRLLFVGSFTRRKDPMTLLQAVNLLARDKIPVKLLCVGRGPEERRMRSYVREENLAEHVAFASHVSTEELVDRYNGSDLVVIPSRLEGFGMVALESMACGTPVIYSRIPPLTEIVGDLGLSFEAGSAIDLSRRIKYAIHFDDFRARVREGGIARAQKFDWSKIADMHLSIYRSALSG